MLEAGSGPGRFTEIAAATGADLVTFDYSTAIDQNRENNRRFPNVTFAQGDLMAPPVAPASFDRVFCLGVLQHLPSPDDGFDSLAKLVKPGGSLVVDCYQRTPIALLHWKYVLRPITRRMPRDRLYAIIERGVPPLLPVVEGPAPDRRPLRDAAPAHRQLQPARHSGRPQPRVVDPRHLRHVRPALRQPALTRDRAAVVPAARLRRRRGGVRPQRRHRPGSQATRQRPPGRQPDGVTNGMVEAPKAPSYALGEITACVRSLDAGNGRWAGLRGSRDRHVSRSAGPGRDRAGGRREQGPDRPRRRRPLLRARASRPSFGRSGRRAGYA